MIPLLPVSGDNHRKISIQDHMSFRENKSKDYFKKYTDVIAAGGNPLMLANNSMCSLAVNASHRISNCKVTQDTYLCFFSNTSPLASIISKCLKHHLWADSDHPTDI